MKPELTSMLAQLAAARAVIDGLEAQVRALAAADERPQRPEWLRIRETPFTATTARRLAREQKIRAVRVGREIRLHAEDVAAYLAASAVQPKARVPARPSDDIDDLLDVATARR